MLIKAVNLSDVWLPAVNDPVSSSPTFNTLVRPHYEYEYDVHGSVTAITDPNGNRTEFAYDTLGRQTSRTLPIGVATTGDPTDFTETRHFDDTPIDQIAGSLALSVGSGQLAYAVDFEGRVTAYRYDNSSSARGRLASTYYYDTEADYTADFADGTLDTAARTVTYTYNAFGQVTQVNDSGHGSGGGVTNHVYDDLGRRTQIESPEGILNYAYNDLNQVTRVWTSKTTAATDAVTDTAYTYDAYGRLETVTATERADVLVPNSGDATTYFYDAVGNLDAQAVENGSATVTTDYVFDSLNRLTGLYHFNDLDADLTYDAGVETLHASFLYTLDSRGNRVASADTVDGHTYNYTWAYDALNRLASEQLAASDSALDYTDTFVYDLAGNRLSKTQDKGSDGSVEETTSYTYDANDRLLAETFDSTDNAADRYKVYTFDGTTQTYKIAYTGLDDTGVIRNRTSMAYNEMGRLESTTVTDFDVNGQTSKIVLTEYGYNTAGLRITETTTTDGGTPVVKSFLFDPRNPTGFAQVLEEYIDGVLAKVFTLGHDVISQTDVTDPQAQETVTLLADGHGSTRALLNDLDAILQEFAYDAYGNMLDGANLTLASAALTSILYSGEWTQANGSQYLRARFYDPVSGRFNRLDPFIGNRSDPQSLHKYLYTHANPVAFVDPTGESVWALRAIAAGAAGALDASIDALLSGASPDEIEAAALTGFGIGLTLALTLAVLPPIASLYAVGIGTTLGVAGALQAAEQGNNPLAIYRAVSLFPRGFGIRALGGRKPGLIDGQPFHSGRGSRLHDAPTTYRDANGRLRSAQTGRFVPDPLTRSSSLHRPSLRSGTKRAIESSAGRNDSGDFVDGDGLPISEINYGHIHGHENRRILLAAEELGLSQAQLNDYVNARPEFFIIQEAGPNKGGVGELQGSDDYGHIVDDMASFLGL